MDPGWESIVDPGWDPVGPNTVFMAGIPGRGGIMAGGKVWVQLLCSFWSVRQCISRRELNITIWSFTFSRI
jgi:hypothetical protein